jgi:hypothetical protein
MLSNLRIIRLRDFISLKPEGDLDYLRVAEDFKGIASIPGVFVDYNVLIDTRGAESHLSATQIWEIARDLAQMVHAGSTKGYRAKIAVICPIKQFDYAKFLAMCAQNYGLNVHAFTSFEEMFEWISESSTFNSDKPI